MTEEKKFLERPQAIVALIGGIVGVVGTAVAVFAALSPSSGATPAEDEAQAAQARVAECVRVHGLSQAVEKRDLGDGRSYFRSCVWPAPSGAGADGFAEITVATEPGPGQSEAEGMTELHVFTSTCRDLEAGYLFDNQGSFVPEQPVRLTKGEARRVEGGSIVPGHQPGRDQFWVFSSARYLLDAARCV